MRSDGGGSGSLVLSAKSSGSRTTRTALKSLRGTCKVIFLSEKPLLQLWRFVGVIYVDTHKRLYGPACTGMALAHETTTHPDKKRRIALVRRRPLDMVDHQVSTCSSCDSSFSPSFSCTTEKTATPASANNKQVDRTEEGRRDLLASSRPTSPVSPLLTRATLHYRVLYVDK